MPGNFEILETLFKMGQEFPVQHRDVIDSEAVDHHGDTLFHVAAIAPYSRVSHKAVELLCEYKVYFRFFCRIYRCS